MCSVDEGDVNDEGYGFCFPGCDTLGCLDGEVCDISGLCVEQMVFPQQLLTRTLGTFAVTDEVFEEVVFDVPDDALSISFTLESSNPVDAGASVIELLGPTGEALYDGFNPITSPMKYVDARGTPIGFIYPNAPSLNLTPGQYTLVVGAYGPDDITVHLHVKSGPSPTQERVPMTFWFMLNSYLNAELARNDPTFQAAVSKMVSIYASAGIDIAPIVYRDVPEPLASEFVAFDYVETPIEEVIGQVLGQRPASGTHMFFNDQLFDSEGSILYGISAGLPGPPAVNDTAALGVFVALDTHDVGSGQLDALELGATMSHELGHYFGLFHISEATGDSHDPLSDTAECSASRDVDGSGELSGGECGEAAATNMMFWTSDEQFTQDQISPAQRWVLHRNPAIAE